MIPLHLSLTGFLSYRDPVDLDFTSLELACIAGPNGAGKSSLLDAMTWALFGQARKRDDSLINAQSAAAEVSLIFAYEGNTYRVQRVKPREKTALLEFHILQPSAISPQPTADVQRPSTAEQFQIPGSQFLISNSQLWKPLTEHSLRETESRIQQTLRMDYETFINASFFLQGKADQFTQQRPSDRKRILGSILGLEVWETYRQRASERRRLVEDEIASLDGRLHEIVVELGEEEARKTRLVQLEADLQRLGRERSTQETALQSIRQLSAALDERSRSVTAQGSQLELTRRRLVEMQNRLGERRQEQGTYAAVVSQAGEIEAAYAAWQEARKELEHWEATASRFREGEKRREEPRLELQAARARLEQELATLQIQQAEAQEVQEQIAVLQP
jgi:exonuclease SbcC